MKRLLLSLCLLTLFLIACSKKETPVEKEVEVQNVEEDNTVPKPFVLPAGMDYTNDYNPAPSVQSSNSTEVSADNLSVSSDGTDDIYLQ